MQLITVIYILNPMELCLIQEACRHLQPDHQHVATAAVAAAAHKHLSNQFQVSMFTKAYVAGSDSSQAL